MVRRLAHVGLEDVHVVGHEVLEGTRILSWCPVDPRPPNPPALSLMFTVAVCLRERAPPRGGRVRTGSPGGPRAARGAPLDRGARCTARPRPGAAGRSPRPTGARAARPPRAPPRPGPRAR